MSKILITTKRLYIRELDEEDVLAEAELFGDPALAPYAEPLLSYDEEVKLRAEYREYVYQRYGYGMWGVFDKSAERLIGEAGLEHRSGLDCIKYPYDWMSDINCAELGFCFAPDIWGCGYCTEACRAITEYCRDAFDIRRVFARADSDNLRSLRVLEKLGFKRFEQTDVFCLDMSADRSAGSD
ncbi:MAG: GNAT family N-acetyltransferase [Lachnospiraceae bacterium]|nr:GNAT family N-acetyltransferase [Lachnospiraceae bacterium]